MDVSYPDQPWDLHGDAAAGVFLVPLHDLPSSPPPGFRPVRILGRAVVMTAFFRYREPSPLTYGEIMATVLVRRGLRLRVFIPQIWVDSPASLAGGRDLWAIPKDLAEFHGDPTTSMEAVGIGSLDVGRTVSVPGWVPAGFRTAQTRGARAVVTPVSGRVRVGLGRGRWRFEGPLSWLSGRRSLLTLAVHRFRLRFGQDAA